MFVYQDAEIYHHTFSTSEADYVALGDAVKELLFLRQVCGVSCSPERECHDFPMFEDNQGAVQFSQNPVSDSIRTTLTFAIIF